MNRRPALYYSVGIVVFLLATIAPYLPGGNARRLATSGNVRVSYLDWSLSDQRTAEE